MLARTTTLFTLLEEYPFLEGFLVARHPAFTRLAQAGGARGWARVTTLGELATAMNVPWLEFLRELRTEVQRETGAVAPIAEDAAAGAADPRLQDALRRALRDLESGASLGELAARLDRETQGLDAEQVAALARAVGSDAADEGALTASSVLQPADAPVTLLALSPGHPVRALLEEGARVRELTSHVEELVDGIEGPKGADRWPRARPALGGLLARLAEIERHADRLRQAWLATVSSRGGCAAAALVDERLGAAVDAVRRARKAVDEGEIDQAAAVSRSATGLALDALAAEEGLLVPVALRVLDDEDWEQVAAQERVVGWALVRDQAL